MFGSAPWQQFGDLVPRLAHFLGLYEDVVLVPVPLNPLQFLIVLANPQVKPLAEDLSLAAVEYLGDLRHAVFTVDGHTLFKKPNFLHRPSM